MGRDIKIFFWLLKLGTLINIYFLVQTFISPLVFVDKNILIPAQILFIVCAYRCLFPVRYTNNIVFHRSVLSSIFITRLLATFSEVGSIYLLAYLLRLLNVKEVMWVNILAWMMFIQVIISQCFVWCAILFKRLKLYVYEEIGWGIIFIINTFVSIYLYTSTYNYSERELLMYLNILFGAFYLPWQYYHLRALCLDAKQKSKKESYQKQIKWDTLMQGFYQSIRIKNKSSLLDDWGGIVGITWATAYWASVMPVWVYFIVRLVSSI